MSCEICRRFDKRMTDENWSAIFDELVQEVGGGTMTYLGGDCPLDETKRHIMNETKFAIIHNFGCECGTRVEWGVCIRGKPLLRLHPMRVATD